MSSAGANISYSFTPRAAVLWSRVPPAICNCLLERCLMRVKQLACLPPAELWLIHMQLEVAHQGSDSMTVVDQAIGACREIFEFARSRGADPEKCPIRRGDEDERR